MPRPPRIQCTTGKIRIAAGNGQRARARPQRIEDSRVGIGQQRPAPGDAVPPDGMRPATTRRERPSRAAGCRGRCPARRRSAGGERIGDRPRHQRGEQSRRKRAPEPPASRRRVPSGSGGARAGAAAGSAKRAGPQRESAQAREPFLPLDAVRAGGDRDRRERELRRNGLHCSSRRRGSCGGSRSRATRKARTDPGSRSRGSGVPGSSRATRTAPGRARSGGAPSGLDDDFAGRQPRQRLERGDERPALPSSARGAGCRGAPPDSRPRLEKRRLRNGEKPGAAADRASGCRTAARGRRRNRAVRVVRPPARKPAARLSSRDKSPRSGSRLKTVPRSQRA